MTRAVSVVLAAVAMALIGTIGFELDESNGKADAMTEAPTPPRNPALPEQAPGPQDREQEWVTTILARPLFSRDRRPPATSEGKAAPAIKDLPRLAGILVSPLGRTAIFAAANSSKSMVVSEGGHLGEFVVRSIDVGVVTIIGPEGQRLVRPSYDSAAAPTSPVASGSPAPPTDTGQTSQGIPK